MSRSAFPISSAYGWEFQWLAPNRGQVPQSPPSLAVTESEPHVRIVCISLSPMPYNTPILNALARRADLQVIYMCKEDRINRFVDIWGEEPTFDYSFFSSMSLHSELIDLQLQLSIGVSRRLAKLALPRLSRLEPGVPTGTVA